MYDVRIIFLYNIFFYEYHFIYFFISPCIQIPESKFIEHISSYECQKEYINIFEKVESLKTLYTHAHKSKIFFFLNILLVSFAALKKMICLFQ